MTRYTKTETTEALERLSALLKPGDTVHTKVTHVARSGMMRVISAYVIRNNSARDISRDVATVIGVTFDNDRYGVKMGGTGMDMTFALVYSLSRALWPSGVHCTGSNGRTPSGKASKLSRCRSNDHVNDYTMPYRKSIVHRDGGYALNREWL